MRANKTRQPQLQIPIFNAQELSRASNEAIQAHVTHGACICCPRGILCAFRGNYNVRCSDMPWACPIASSRQTPTV